MDFTQVICLGMFSLGTPIVTTDQMTDWHSMMVSIMWNVQAWKTWIYNSIKKILTFQENSGKKTFKYFVYLVHKMCYT